MRLAKDSIPDELVDIIHYQKEIIEHALRTIAHSNGCTFDPLYYRTVANYVVNDLRDMMGGWKND